MLLKLVGKLVKEIEEYQLQLSARPTLVSQDGFQNSIPHTNLSILSVALRHPCQTTLTSVQGQLRL